MRLATILMALLVLSIVMAGCGKQRIGDDIISPTVEVSEPAVEDAPEADTTAEELAEDIEDLPLETSEVTGDLQDTEFEDVDVDLGSLI